MQEKLKAIREEALKAIEQADMPEKLNDVRVKFLGKKGRADSRIKEYERCCHRRTDRRLVSWSMRQEQQLRRY